MSSEKSMLVDTSVQAPINGDAMADEGTKRDEELPHEEEHTQARDSNFNRAYLGRIELPEGLTIL